MEPFEYFPSRPADAENLARFRRALAGLDRYRPLARSPERVRSQRMDRRRLLIVVVPAALAVCAGVAFAVPGGGHHVVPRGPVATHHARTTPSPSPTHDASDATAPTFYTRPWNGNDVPGTYLLIMAAVRPGTLADNRFDVGDVLAAGATRITFAR